MDRELIQRKWEVKVSHQGLVWSQDIKRSIPTQEIIIATLARKLSGCLLEGFLIPVLFSSYIFLSFPTLALFSRPVQLFWPTSPLTPPGPELNPCHGQSTAYCLCLQKNVYLHFLGDFWWMTLSFFFLSNSWCFGQAQGLWSIENCAGMCFYSGTTITI